MSILTFAYHALQVIGVFAILTWFLVPLPLLTYKQGEEKREGRVTSIKKVWFGAYEIGLTQGLDIDSRCLTNGVVSMSGSTTTYATLRFWQTLPKIGDTIESHTQSRYYHLRNRSFGWVHSWKHVTNISPGGYVTVK